MNVIVGVIVDSTMNTSQLTGQEIKAQEVDVKVKRLHELAEAVMSVDLDGDGALDFEEVSRALEHPMVADYLRDIALPIAPDARELLDLLDTEGDEELTCERLVMQLLRNVLQNDT